MSQAVPSASAGWGRLLGRTFEVYRSKFLTLIGITAVVFLPITLLSTLTQVINIPMMAASNQLQNLGPYADPQAVSQLAAQSMALSGVSLLISCCTLLAVILVYPLGYGAQARAVCDGCLGRAGGFASAFRQAFRMWPRYILVVLLIIAIGILAAIWAVIPCVGWLTGPGLFVVIWLVYLFAPIILIMERNKGVVDTLRRAWDLVRRRFWQVVGPYVMVSVATALVSVALYGIASVLMRSLGPGLIPGWESLNISGRLSVESTVVTVLSLPLILLVGPFTMTLAGVLYFDVRTQTEGFDAAAYTAGAGEGAGQISDLAGDAPAAETGNLITMQEVGYAVALSVGAIVYVACIYGIILVTNPEILDAFR